MNGTLMSLVVVEVALTVVAAGMFLWRGVLDMKEEDQLILDDAESHLVREQAAIRERVGMVSKYLKIVSVAWGVLAVVILGVWVADGLGMM